MAVAVPIPVPVATFPAPVPSSVVVASRHVNRVPRRESDHVWSFAQLPRPQSWYPQVALHSMEENPQQTQPKPSYEPRFMLSGHTMSVSSVKFSPDGAMLASAGEFRFLVMADVFVVVMPLF